MKDALIVMLVLLGMTIFIMVFGIWYAGRI